MKHITQKNWSTGSNEPIDFYDILKIIKEYRTKGSKVFIGSDSFISQKKVCFASTIYSWATVCSSAVSLPSTIKPSYCKLVLVVFVSD